MNIDVGVLIAQLINFGILFFLFNKFLSEPISKEIQTRKEQISKMSNIDKQLEEKMLEANKMAEDIKSEARKTAQETIDSSVVLAKKKADDIVAKADSEAKNKVSDAQKEIEKERLSMMNNAKAKITGLVLSLNRKLFDEEKTNKEFIEKEIEGIKL
ncbi:MAG: ATP synthase F0 subunit B [Candidatus Gracilibacteria bacterium]|nr:ATP synthase F0 subunit B [Candidatus Gracilibacteria bacterium]